MYRSVKIGILSAFLLLSITAFGQGKIYLFGQLISSPELRLPEVAKIKANKDVVSFHFNNNAGARQVLYNNESRLQMSSVSNGKDKRHVSASITSGSVPKGTTLKLSLKEQDSFKGNAGDCRSDIVLNKNNKVVLDDIGTCYSGKGTNDGYEIEYVVVVPAQKKVSTQKEMVIVTLTLFSEV